MEKKKVPGEDTGPDRVTQEKTSLGGASNTGVTSDDPSEKEEVEKKGTLAEDKKSSEKDNEQPPAGGLTKEEIPDSTNQSTGVPGSGQRQDSN